MHMLLLNWAELAGSALILGGLTLAAWTLAKKGTPSLAFGHWARLPVPTLAEAESMPRIEAVDEWQRLEEIAERGFSGIARLVDLQEFAAEEIAAADEAMRELLAGYAAAIRPIRSDPPKEGTGADPQPEFAPPVPLLAA
jgi:hypothetical protein